MCNLPHYLQFIVGTLDQKLIEIIIYPNTQYLYVKGIFNFKALSL